MAFQVRRVVTGHDKGGKSCFLMDGIAPNIMEMASMPGLALTDLWETRGAPASNRGTADAAKRRVRLEPPRNGTILRIVEFPPDSQWRGSADGAAAFKSIGAGHAKDKGSADPMMHKTATVDYIIVLRGEIYAVMDTGETLLKPGDILVQRGTNHSWSVRGSEPCVVAAILVSADPVEGARKGVRKRSAAKKAAAASKAKRAAGRKPALRRRGRRTA